MNPLPSHLYQHKQQMFSQGTPAHLKWKKGSAKVGHQIFDRVQQQNIFKSIDLLQNNLKR